MLRDSFVYAARSLLRRRLRSWLTIIGIFIGIAAVVSLISLGQGLREAVAMQFSSLGSDSVTIQPAGGVGFGPPGLGAAVTLDEDDLRVVKRSQHVEDAAGEPVEDARISVDGGMPQHDHGLPTAPEVTRELGRGDYLVEGLRFHMNGYWEIVVEIRVDGRRDTVTIPLQL